MSFSLPWFPGGDETGPSQPSLIHRYASDYYQTYDLFLSQSTLIAPSRFVSIIREPADQNILLPFGARIAVERFHPNKFPSQSTWIQKYYNWQDAWRKIDFRFLEITPTQFNVTWPLVFAKDVEISYLTFDYSFNQQIINGIFDYYVRVNEKVKQGQEWTPRYPPVFNSMQFSEPVELGDIQGLLSEANWVLPFPSGQLPRREEVLERRAEGNFASSTTHPVITLDTTACYLEERTVDNTIQGPFLNLTEAVSIINSFEPRQGKCFFDRILGFFVQNTTGISDSAVQVGGIGGGIDVVFGTIEEAEAAGFIVPEEPGDVLYFVNIELSEAPELNCQAIGNPETTVLDETTNVQEQFIDLTLDEHHCIVAANNNYWGYQSPIQSQGLPPKLFIPTNNDRPDEIRDILLSSSLEQLRGPFYGLVNVPEESSFGETVETTEINYDHCLGNIAGIDRIEKRVSIRESSRTSFFVNVSRRVLLGFFGQVIFVEATDSVLIDQYYLANNGSELEVTMPDSIRMKEIHAALFANYFGNGEEKQIKVYENLFPTKEISEQMCGSAFEFGDDSVVNVTTLFDWINRKMDYMWSFMGLHNYPVERQPTYQPLDNQGNRDDETELLLNAFEHHAKEAFEINAKLGLWPMETFNYSKLDPDTTDPEPTLYLGAADVLGDLFALSTRQSVTSEKASLNAFRADAHTIEILKAIGSPLLREEVEWDYGSTEILIFNGALSLVSMFTTWFAEQALTPIDFLPEDLVTEIEEAKSRVSGNPESIQEFIGAPPPRTEE